METVGIVDTVIASDKEAFMRAFNDALASKIEDALEVKKVELASSLITTQQETEVTNEPEEIASEVVGTDDSSEQ